MDVYEVMKVFGIQLPKAPVPGGIYTPIREFGQNFAYTSGMGCNIEGGALYKGKIGQDLTLEQGQKAARCCMLNILSSLEKQIGDLNRVKKVVKVLAFVASSPDFYEQPKVVNAASQLLVDIFGEDNGKGARSAIGTNVLPGNIPVEIEVLFELNS
jgi:enamine deaminase RidA (YjgF/YER057c/UK114 family)